MNIIKNYLNGGFLEKPCSGPNKVKLIVYKFENLFKKTIPLLNNYSLIGVKSLDFKYFVKLAYLMATKLHLTEKGYN